LDTDTLVDQLTSGLTSKIAKQQQEKQKITWKQDVYRDITKALQDFTGKYLTASSASSILSPSFFEQFTTTVSSNKVAISGDMKNANNVQVTGIDQLATKAQVSVALSQSSPPNFTSLVGDPLNDTPTQIQDKVKAIAGKTVKLFVGDSYATASTRTFTLKARNSSLTYDQNTNAILDDFNQQLSSAYGTRGGNQTVSAHISQDPLTSDWSFNFRVAPPSSSTDPSVVFGIQGMDPELETAFPGLVPQIGVLNKVTSISSLASVTGLSATDYDRDSTGGTTPDSFSLVINGKDIDGITADISVGALINKINNSGAGVKAIFSEVTGQISIETQATGTAAEIRVQGSELAAKLFGAPVTTVKTQG
jgi:flagellar capping protein FliD